MLNNATITTNNHEREFIPGYTLTEKERKEFDYLSDDDLECRDFIRYKGWLYDSHEFVAINHPQWGILNVDLADWHGYQPDSYFSGLLLWYSEDGERYKIATYTS